VVETASLESTAQKIGSLLGIEPEFTAETCRLNKKRLVKNSESRFSLLDLRIAIRSFKENGTAFNKASVYLLPEELPTFVLALMQHPISFPTNFSQYQIVKNGVYCIQLESEESPEDFAERLSAALLAIEN
jgi:hypothetical protein